MRGMAASRGIRLAYAFLALLVLLVATLLIVFGLTNLQPGFPKLEAAASLTAGGALLASLFIARRSMLWACLTALLGALPLVAWFVYAVAVPKSSDPVFLFLSLVVPTAAGLGAMLTARRRDT